MGSNATGFTLIELLVTIAVLVIVVTVGVPGLMDIVRNNRSTTQANDLVAGMQLARSEAIKRGIPVSVCAADDGTAATDCRTGGNDWSGGWIVFTDDAGVAGQIDGSDQVLRTWRALAGNPELDDEDGSPQPFLRYGPDGLVTGSAALVLTPDGCQAEQQRRILVGTTGRPSVLREDCP